VSDVSDHRLALYADGELPPEERHALELELVRSQEARERVVALQQEAELLRDALQDRPLPQRRSRAAARSGRGLALGLGPALAAALAVTTAAGWWLDLRPPTGLSWLNPLAWIGAVEMLFDLVFWLRAQAPALLQLGAAVAVTASVSALLSFAVTLLYRRLVGPGALGLAVLLSLVASAGDAPALEIRTRDESVTVAADETVGDSLVVASHRTYVDGVVDGDLAAFTERLSIRGEVRGDVYAFAKEVEIAGRVTGSVHAFGERLDLGGRIDGDLLAAGETAVIPRSGRVERDATLFAQDVLVDGEVGRNLFAGGERLELRGSVGGGAELRGEDAELFGGARVERDLVVRLEDPERLRIADDALVGGEVRRLEPEHPLREKRNRFLRMAFYGRLAVFLVAGFLVGLGLFWLVPGLLRQRVETAPAFFRALGQGLVAVVVTPVLLVALFVTVVGIPVALIGLWVYLTALFLSVIVVASLTGRSLLRRDPRRPGGFGVVLLVGLAVTLVAMSLPWVGGLVAVIVVLTGTGLLVEGARDLWRRGPGAP